MLEIPKAFIFASQKLERTRYTWIVLGEQAGYFLCLSHSRFFFIQDHRYCWSFPRKHSTVWQELLCSPFIQGTCVFCSFFTRRLRPSDWFWPMNCEWRNIAPWPPDTWTRQFQLVYIFPFPLPYCSRLISYDMATKGRSLVHLYFEWIRNILYYASEVYYVKQPRLYWSIQKQRVRLLCNYNILANYVL